MGRTLGPGFHLIQGGPARGCQIWVDPAIRRAYLLGAYEVEMTDAIVDHCQSGMVAIDIGAHNRYFTLVMAKCVGALGRCVAFEPLPQNFVDLQRTIQVNHLTNVQAEQIAVSDQDGDSAFFVHDLSSMGRIESLVNAELQPAFASGETVHLARLDTYVSQAHLPRVDFMKIDAEGAERLIVRGAVQIIRTFRPILLVEVHDFEPADQHARPCIDEPRALGYSVLDIATNRPVDRDQFSGGRVLGLPN